MSSFQYGKQMLRCAQSAMSLCDTPKDENAPIPTPSETGTEISAYFQGSMAESIFSNESTHMIHEILPVGMLACNCSILADEASQEAIIIDPGDETERIARILNRHHLKVKAIVATHAHIDHVGGIEKLHRATGAPVHMHQNDLPLYENMAVQAAWLGMETPGTVPVAHFIKEGDVIRAGNLALDVLWTPGHSPGSLLLYLPGETKRIFSGDTLFKESIGRTDLWGGDMQQILRSIKNTLLHFSDETPVFPGHGPATTIGEERERNPFLREL